VVQANKIPGQNFNIKIKKSKKEYKSMNKFRFVLQTFVFLGLALAFPALADAQATRTWVSGVGDDVNPCSRTAPCKTFAGAISKTATNGEINCLDPAGYGAVTITKSITIDCEDTQGSILSAGTNGVVVNITSALDTKKTVRLRGLSITGVSNTAAASGVRVLAASIVAVEDTVINGYQNHGISIETTSGTPKITVDRVSIRGMVGNGINTFITGGSVNLAISNSVFFGNATGVNLSNNTKGTMRNSSAVNNTTGIAAFSAEMNVYDCMVSGNTTGIFANSSSTFRLYGNIVTSNSTGLSSSGGAILSSSNNQVDGNTTNGAPTGFIPNT
jgi:parallel beta-helix repeat protein